MWHQEIAVSCSRSAANRDLWDWEKGTNDSFMSVTFTPLAPSQNSKSTLGERRSTRGLRQETRKKKLLLIECMHRRIPSPWFVKLPSISILAFLYCVASRFWTTVGKTVMGRAAALDKWPLLWKSNQKTPFMSNKATCHSLVTSKLGEMEESKLSHSVKWFQI